MRTKVQFELEYDDQKTPEAHSRFFDVTFDFVAVPELFSDVERVLYESVKEKLEEKCIMDSTVVASAEVLGTTLSNADTYTEDYDQRQKKKEVNIDSLKNDVMYVNSILASAGDIDPTKKVVPDIDIALVNASGIIHEGRKWLYYIMNKHFDEPIPEGFEPEKPVESKPVE